MTDQPTPNTAAGSPAVLREPWCAYAQEGIYSDNGGYMVVYVEENEPGYYPTTYTADLTPEGLGYVKGVAASINESRGITPERALEIVHSSFAAGSKR